MVKVTPEVKSKAVLIVGSQKGPMVVKGSTMSAGEPVTPAAMLGHTALKPGHSKALSKLAASGIECARPHHRAVKKAPKNMTSEKMNQLMLQRKEMSMRRPYWPPSLSLMASPNHPTSTQAKNAKPR